MELLGKNEVIKLDYMHELIESMEDSVISSYEVLSNGVYEDHTKYQLALSFLNLAETNYVNYLREIHEIRAERDETYTFETSYNEFKHELHSYVLQKDTNPTWLSSRKDAFIQKSTILKDFISEVVRNYYNAK